MSMKQALIIAVVCVVCFGASFMIAWITRPAPSTSHEPNVPAATEANDPFINAISGASLNSEDPTLSKTLTEKQLKLLVQNLRARIEEYDTKLQDLSAREHQLQVSRVAFQSDVNELNRLRVELASASSQVKAQKQELADYQTKITTDELANLKRTATIYDKMDSTSASKILISLCKSKQIDDAVKIINYMSERSAAKVIGEIGTAEPQIAADIVQAIKRLKEVK
ncbi:MAG: hypothetical protein A2Y07_09180 [Planctomycetes bacterium GWF2_50_10]|nr:MAG: hypothetical protein A2Y07_09180 [Planctomycetes bacterium GWF2_50_10]